MPSHALTTDLQKSDAIFGTASGTDTYTIGFTPAITSYSIGQRFFVLFTNANTGASTINVDTLGAKAIVKNGATALASGDISAGQIYAITYDGTNFQLVGKITASGTVLTPASVSTLNTGTDNVDYASALGLEGSKYLNQSGSKVSATASGTNTYTATISPAITAYASTQRFFITFTNANTGAVTINLNGLGAKAITKKGTKALTTGDIFAGQILLIAYDGTRFQIVGSPLMWNPPEIPLGSILSSGVSFFVNGTGNGTGVYATFDSASNDRMFFNESLPFNGAQYDGSSIAIVLRGRLSTNGGVGDNLKFDVNYSITGLGDNSSTTSTTIATQTVDVSSQLANIQFEIQLGSMTGTALKQTLMFMVRRFSSGAGSDTYAGDYELTSISLKLV